jgi:hypothetical protein
MSNALAIAAVSATLRDELTNAFAAAGISLSPLIGSAQAFVGAPGRTHGDAAAGVDIFLYRVGPNPDLANYDLPTRNGAGDLVEVPTTALTLWYLLTFFGDTDQLVPEQLLGVVTARLNLQPVLTPAQISAAITTPLPKADLQDQPEYVRLRRVPLTDDEMNRIWSMLPTEDFALSVVYEASVVLIESDADPTQALPVTERGLAVLASGSPVVAAVGPAAGPHAPILPGTELTVRGAHLAGPGLRVQIDGVPVPAASITVRGPGELRVTLDAGIRPGAHGLAVGHTRPTGFGAQTQELLSNPAPFFVRPVITQMSKPAGFVRAHLSTAVLPAQHLELIFNEVTSAAHLVLAATATPSGQHLRVPITDIPNGTYIVRARVDGVASSPQLPATPTNPNMVVVP